jgi:hypothetical protein
MGWKKVKEHYRIGHLVIVEDGKLLIGSPYIRDIIVVNADGTIKKDYDTYRTLSGELARYEQEISASKELFAQLFAEEDVFEISIPVYTFDDDGIHLKYCEDIDWPNVTHDGQMMYENRFSTDYRQVVKWALRDAELGVKYVGQAVKKIANELEERRTYQAMQLKRLMDLQVEAHQVGIVEDH